MLYTLLATALVAVATIAIASIHHYHQGASQSQSPNKNNIQKFYFSNNNINYELSTNTVPPDFCDPNSNSFSGYFGVKGSKFDTSNSNSHKHYFYWFFDRRSTSLSGIQQNQTDENEIPLLIWLNGGPGCSSLLGLLEENGPCLINPDGHSTRINPYSWTEAAHVLYLDQPSLAGYSYSDVINTDDRSAGVNEDNNDDMVAEDAYYFIQSFLMSEEGSRFRSNPLYLTGESYAGHYIPAIAHRIKQGNANLKPNHIHIPLSGLAIGNGFYNMEEQVKSFPEMAYNNIHGLQIITKEEYKSMTIAAKSCSADAHKCKTESNPLIAQLTCQKATNCEEEFFKPLGNNGRNISIYDITKPCIGELCTDETPITTFLNLNTTKEILGVPQSIKWEPCGDHLNRIWSLDDRIENFAPYVSEMLNDDIPVLIYSGDLDYICNYIGNRAVAMKLDWKYGDDFRAADEHDWNNGGGLARSARGLNFLQVYNAGHMVPGDQPEQALIMIRQFLNGEPF